MRVCQPAHSFSIYKHSVKKVTIPQIQKDMKKDTEILCVSVKNLHVGKFCTKRN